MDYPKEWINYTREELLAILSKNLSKKRYQHILRVEEEALKLADYYHADCAEVSLAALLHDYAKERSDAEYLHYIDEHPQFAMLRPYGNNIWHGMIGALFAKKELGLNNPNVVRAIQLHTVGGKQMTQLDKIIFIADYIEPNRHFEGVDEARKLAYTNLNQAVSYALSHTLIYLIQRGYPIFPMTLDAYNHWVGRIGDE